MIIQVANATGVEAVISDIMRDTQALDTGNVSINPSIDASTVRQKAIDFMAVQYENLQFEATLPKLMLYSPAVVGNSGPARLVWRTEVGNLGDPVVKELILVDAHNSEIPFHYSLICSAMYREVTDVYPNPDEFYDEANCCPTGGYIEVDLAFEYLEDTYGFYDIYHSRDGWDDKGSKLVAYVRYPHQTENAWWLGSTIFVGEGHLTDDTIGHEFTHGVIQTDSQLVYSGEAGAITESLCDMWGEWIDLENGVSRSESGTDDPDDKWELWEDDLYYESISDKRYMKDPPVFGTACGEHMPDRRGSNYWYDPQGGCDSGGVHHNCGVGNKLAYLLCDGTSGEPTGQFNGYTMTGLNIPDTAALFYECQRYLLPQSLDYYDLGYLLLLAARNLGMTLSEQAEVEKACRAVEIYNGNCVFSIQDSEGVRVAWFDDLGNLYLAGRQLGIDGAMEAHWKLDETTGSEAADSVGGNNGTLSGSPEWVTGTIDGALDFAGAQDQDYVAIGARLVALTGNNVTISAWINADDPGADYSPILRQYFYNTNFYGYDLSLIAGNPSFCLDNYVAQAVSAVGPDEWHHLVGTYDGETEILRIYVDGRMREVSGISSTGTETSPYMGWGVDSSGNHYFDGTIDDVRVYNYALNRKEVHYFPSPNADELVFRIENSEDATVAGFDASGYLFLEGDVEEGVTDMDPLEGNDQFVITDNSGDPVAYFAIEGDSCDLYLAGKLYQ